MIESAISELQKEGITRVCLNVMETNEYGKSFWQKRGWEKKDFLGFYSKSITDKENLPLLRAAVSKIPAQSPRPLHTCLNFVALNPLSHNIENNNYPV